MSTTHLSLRRPLTSALCLIGVVSLSLAHAEVVTDPKNDFLPSYIGPKNGDMDAVSSDVILNTVAKTLTFSGTVNGNVGSTSGGAWVWGLDRGKGTERFQPAFGAGVKFDSVVALFANQTGAFIDLIAGTPPQAL